MSAPFHPSSSDYITVNEFCAAYKYARQSVYNMISTGKFELNYHYYKPSRKKVLFSKNKIEEWIQSKPSECSPAKPNAKQTEPHTVKPSQVMKKTPLSNDINITD